MQSEQKNFFNHKSWNLYEHWHGVCAPGASVMLVWMCGNVACETGSEENTDQRSVPEGRSKQRVCALKSLQKVPNVKMIY